VPFVARHVVRLPADPLPSSRRRLKTERSDLVGFRAGATNDLRCSFPGRFRASTQRSTRRPRLRAACSSGIGLILSLVAHRLEAEGARSVYAEGNVFFADRGGWGGQSLEILIALRADACVCAVRAAGAQPPIMNHEAARRFMAQEIIGSRGYEVQLRCSIRQTLFLGPRRCRCLFERLIRLSRTARDVTHGQSSAPSTDDPEKHRPPPTHTTGGQDNVVPAGTAELAARSHCRFR
jgi:hypothetical protein